MGKKVFCIVLNWNGKHYLKKCLDSITGNSYKNIVIVVVDNASTDGSQEFVKKNYPQIELIVNKENLGWTGGNNKGVRYALKNKADCIFVINNDTEIEKNCIRELLKVLYSNESIGIVGPKIYLSEQNGKRTKKISFAGGKFTPNRFFGVHIGINKIDKGQFSKVQRTEFITGAAILIKSEVFKKIGVFDRRFFIYYEEADFCLRAKKRGYDILFCPSAHVYHMFSGTVELNSPFQNYFTTRNHYLFVEKNAPLLVKLREFLRTPKTVYEFYNIKDENKKKYSLLGIRDYYLRNFGKRIYW